LDVGKSFNLSALTKKKRIASDIGKSFDLSPFSFNVKKGGLLPISVINV
jgi:hypothetical protein